MAYGFGLQKAGNRRIVGLSPGLWVIDGSIIELDAHVFAPEFYLVGREVRAVISDDAVGDHNGVQPRI